MVVVFNLVQWWGLEVVGLKGGCAFGVIGDWCGRSCFALALFGGCLSFRVSFLVWSLVLRTLLYSVEKYTHPFPLYIYF